MIITPLRTEFRFVVGWLVVREAPGKHSDLKTSATCGSDGISFEGDDDDDDGDEEQ
jgi:hypothetical protein